MTHILGITLAIVLAGALMGSPGAVRFVRWFFAVLGWIIILGVVLLLLGSR
jgi:hypothetical protein